MRLIQFGSENGSTQAGKAIFPLQKKLNSIFFESDEERSLFNDFDFLSIVFRVSGKNKNFGFEGAERLKKSRGRRTLTIDLSIPENRWKESESMEFGMYIAEGVKVCFEKLKDELTRLQDVENLVEINNRFQNGIEEFCSFIQSMDDNA